MPRKTEIKQKEWWENEEEYFQNKRKGKLQDNLFGYRYDEEGYIGAGVYADDDYDDNYLSQYSFDDKIGKEKNWGNYWDDYQKTGVWKGWDAYRTPQLDYRYVEQMANAFAAKYNISVKVGKYWCIDINKRMLTYNPLTLLSGSKANLMATLLHEIGHLRYSEPKEKLKSIWFKYSSSEEVVNIFEDFRIDKLMLKAYEGAEDVFKANKPIVEKYAEQYTQTSQRLKNIVVGVLKNKIEYGEKLARKMFEETKGGTSFDIILDKVMKDAFGMTYTKIRKKLNELKEKMDKTHTIDDYCAHILCRGYGLEMKTDDAILSKRLEKTNSVIEKSKNVNSTVDVLRLLEKEVFPVIADLLKDKMKGLSKTINDVVGKNNAKNIIDDVSEFLKSNRETDENVPSINVMRSNDGQQEAKKNYQARIVSSGESEETIPPEWRDGDYDSIMNSVRSYIDELVRRLTFIKRNDMSLKWIGGTKRGRINTRTLYRYKSGDDRIFKAKREVCDRISSFVFSLIVDVSGSMSGAPIVHSTRGLVLLAEVFQKMQIPFELIAFDDCADTLKRFNEDKMVDKNKTSIGGLTNRYGGGTNLYRAFDAMELSKQPEKNKFAIILSDGGVGSSERYHKYFNKFEKQRIKTIGVSVRCGNEIVNLCRGSGFEIDDVATMPEVFATLLKNLIK